MEKLYTKDPFLILTVRFLKGYGIIKKRNIFIIHFCFWYFIIVDINYTQKNIEKLIKTI